MIFPFPHREKVEIFPTFPLREKTENSRDFP